MVRRRFGEIVTVADATESRRFPWVLCKSCGLCYGYRVLRETDARGEAVLGGRTIDEAEARIIQRIFREFVDGRSPRAIAKALNVEHVLGSSGCTWTASAIHGNRKRGTGILNKELYIGRRVWNRLRYSKDPATGKRVSRPNPPNLCVTVEVPELRILSDELWHAAKQRQLELELPERSQKIRSALNTRHRARYLLSGLLVRGVCGAGYTLIGGDQYGCANHVNRGTCSNVRTVARKTIERRVLSGLKDKLLAPELVATFVKEFQEEWNRQATEVNRTRCCNLPRNTNQKPAHRVMCGSRWLRGPDTRFSEIGEA